MVIDEISMVSATMLEFIHKRLCTIKANTNLFGGLNIITVGDFFQLKPVSGSYAFEHPFLWNFFKPFFLEENVRQSSDSTYADLLNRTRVGLLSNKDIAILNNRVKAVKREQLAVTVHLFPTLKQVKKHNEEMQKLITEKEVKIIEAQHYFSQYDINPKDVVDDDLIPEDDRDAGGLANTLKISEGTRIMLIRNIFTSKGLVNGAIGYVTK